MSQTPVWKGPKEDGITVSLIKKFLQDRERFRIFVIEGLKEPEEFSYPIEFGNCWHLCEENSTNWEVPLKNYLYQLCRKYPFHQEEIIYLESVIYAMFPVFLEFQPKWKTQKSEMIFDQIYSINKNQSVRLRGKIDALITLSDGSYWLREIKTRSQINYEKVHRQLAMDFQCMTYCTVLSLMKQPVKGIHYSIIKRSTHRPKKSETYSDFQQRLQEIIRENPDAFFYHTQIPIHDQLIQNFEKKCLRPVLLQLLYWWETCNSGQDLYESPHGIHWQQPYGIESLFGEGGITRLDDYLETGDRRKLQVVTDLFPELRNHYDNRNNEI